VHQKTREKVLELKHSKSSNINDLTSKVMRIQNSKGKVEDTGLKDFTGDFLGNFDDSKLLKNSSAK